MLNVTITTAKQMPIPHSIPNSTTELAELKMRFDDLERRLARNHDDFATFYAKNQQT